MAGAPTNAAVKVSLAAIERAMTRVCSASNRCVRDCVTRVCNATELAAEPNNGLFSPLSGTEPPEVTWYCTAVLPDMKTDGQRGLDCRHRVVLGHAAIALLTRTAMHRDHRDAGAFSAPRQAQGIALAVAPAGAHLQRHRHAVWCAGLHHGIDDGQRQRLVLHQRRARPLFAHLLGRATHIDVDDLRATIDVVSRRFGHHGRLGASDLHRDGLDLAIVVGPARGLERCPQVLARSHHLTDGITRTEPLAQLTKRPVGHARHRGDKKVIRQFEFADAHEGGAGVGSEGVLKKQAEV